MFSYYNDLWMLDLEELRWESVGDAKAHRPSKRSDLTGFLK